MAPSPRLRHPVDGDSEGLVACVRSDKPARNPPRRLRASTLPKREGEEKCRPSIAVLGHMPAHGTLTPASPPRRRRQRGACGMCQVRQAHTEPTPTPESVDPPETGG